jgi:hypothetical protein
MLKRMFTMRKTAPLVLCSSLAIGGAACKGTDSGQQNAVPPRSANVPVSGAPTTLRGTVESASPRVLVLKSNAGTDTVTLTQPFRVYGRVPSSLSKVKEGVFIGVTTVKQPDGSERATEIHVFPEEMRGLGEGSRMMAPDTSAVARRMTNGNVTTSRMSNGNVTRSNGSTLVVQYPGGTQTVTVPPNTPVTEFAIISRELKPGDRVSVPVRKETDGSMSADKAISMKR